MTEKLKTGMCVLALLLSLLAAWKQEAAYQKEQASGHMIQPAPFSAFIPVN